MNRVNRWFEKNALWVLSLAASVVFGAILGMLLTKAETDRLNSWLSALSALGTAFAAFAAFYAIRLTRASLNIQLRDEQQRMTPNVFITKIVNSALIIDPESPENPMMSIDAEVVNMSPHSIFLKDVTFFEEQEYIYSDSMILDQFFSSGQSGVIQRTLLLPRKVKDGKSGTLVFYFQYAPSGVVEYSLSVSFNLVVSRTWGDGKWINPTQKVMFVLDKQPLAKATGPSSIHHKMLKQLFSDTERS